MTRGRKTRIRTVKIDENDVMIADFNADPGLFWCYTKKFPRSCCLTDRKSGKAAIFINVRDLRSRRLARSKKAALVSMIYLDYAVTHELVHYGAGNTDMPEKVWDKRLFELVMEQWQDEVKPFGNR